MKDFDATMMIDCGFWVFLGGMQCKGIVEQYGPFVLENLDEMLDSKAVCCKIGVCQAPCPRIPWAKLSKQSKPIIELPEAKSSEQSKPVIELPLAHLVA